MSRKRRRIWLGLAAATALSGAAFWGLTYQPAFYRNARSSALSSADHARQVTQLMQAAIKLAEAVRDEDRWSQQFSEKMVNCWLGEELPTRFAAWRPAGVEEPRIRFDQDTIRIGFVTRRGLWSGVVSVKLRVWVSAPNQLACEIQALQAGLVPIPAGDMLQDLVDDLNDAGWRVEWKSGDDADVLLVHVEANPAASPAEHRAVLEAVEVGPGWLRVSGKRQPSAVAGQSNREAVSQVEGPSDAGTK